MRHMHQVITFVETSPEFSQNDVNNLRQLSRELSLIDNLFRALPVFTPSSYRAPVRYTGAVGRPSYEISREQIMLLRSCYFSWTSIASILGVSRWTIHRRAIDLDIPPSFLTYSPIQQVELQQIVQEELVSMPGCLVAGKDTCKVHYEDVGSVSRDGVYVMLLSAWIQLVELVVGHSKYHVGLTESHIPIFSGTLTAT